MESRMTMTIASIRERAAAIASRAGLLPGLLLLIFVLAGGLRVHFLNTIVIPSERQYRSAIISRAIYYQWSNAAQDWKREVAEVSRQRADFLEPPVQEMISAAIYLVIGRENLWIPRFLSSIFWLLGGVSLFFVARRMMSSLAAGVVVCYYLFLPIGVLTSISFQPDSLMMVLFLSGLLLILRYSEKPSKGRLLAAASVAAIAILVRPLCLFTLTASFGAVALYQARIERMLRTRHVLLFLGISLLPGLLYYTVAIAGGRYVASQAETSFVPSLLLDRRFWEGWLYTATGTVGVGMTAAGLLGLAVRPNTIHKAFLFGLGVGYVIFCLTFTYYIRFASHYHLQLAVIVSLSAGGLVDLFVRGFEPHRKRLLSWALTAAAMGMVVFFNYQQIKGVVNTVTPIEPPAVAREIGELVGHSTNTVFLAAAYGMALEYHGEFSGVHWPRAEKHWAFQKPGDQPLSVEERLEVIPFRPEYFIITDLVQYQDNHSDLQAYLAEEGELISDRSAYRVYRLK